MVTMLSITAKVRTLVGELDLAIHVCDDLLGTLENCPKDQLTDRVGIFARQMPDYKILTQERKSGIDVIRQICTQELSIEEGKSIIQRSRTELKNTRQLIKL